MKKIFMFVAVAAAAFMISCSSPADKGKAYAQDLLEALEAEDMEEVEALGDEMDEYLKGLSEEEEKEFQKAFLDELGVGGLAQLGEFLDL